MESRTEKHNEATNNRPEGTRPLDAPIFRINLGDVIPQIRSEVAYRNGDRNAITVLHNEHLRIVVIALKEGAGMNRHSVDAAMAVQVLSGRLWIESDEASYSADEGEVVAMQPRLSHHIFAEKEAVFLLTLAGDCEGEF